MGNKNGLRNGVRKALPNNLVKFLKERKILCIFLEDYLTDLRVYVNQRKKLDSDISRCDKMENTDEEWFLTFDWKTNGHFYFWQDEYKRFKRWQKEMA